MHTITLDVNSALADPLQLGAAGRFNHHGLSLDRPITPATFDRLPRQAAEAIAATAPPDGGVDEGEIRCRHTRCRPMPDAVVIPDSVQDAGVLVDTGVVQDAGAVANAAALPDAVGMVDSGAPVSQSGCGCSTPGNSLSGRGLGWLLALLFVRAEFLRRRPQPETCAIRISR